MAGAATTCGPLVKRLLAGRQDFEEALQVIVSLREAIQGLFRASKGLTLAFLGLKRKPSSDSEACNET